MYCSKCGNKLGDDVKFCQDCGTPVTINTAQARDVPDHEVTLVGSSPVHHPIGRILMSVLAVIGAMFIGALATYMVLNMRGTSIERTSDIISKSQVETAKAFASAIASDDFETAIALFGCERRAKSLNFTEYIARTHSWNSITVSYPSSTNIFTNANQQYLRNTASNQVSGLVFSLNADEAYLDAIMMQDNGESNLAAEISEYCSLENLDTFKILRIDYAMPDVQNTDASIKNAESLAAIYGGQTIEDCTVLYEYNGKTYFGGMQFIQYDDGWYIYNAYTILGGQTVYGYLTEMSESEYTERVEASDWDFKQE